MARAGTYTYYNAFTIFLDYNTTKDIANNRSTVNVRFGVTCNNNARLEVYQRDCPITVAGSTKTATMPAINHSGGTTTYYSSYVSFSIPHNSDGSKRVSMVGSYNVQVTLSGQGWQSAWTTYTENVTLPSIGRATTITSVGQIVVTDSGIRNLSLSLSKKQSSYQHVIQIYMGSVLVASWNRSTIANQDGTRSLVLSESTRTKILNNLGSSSSGSGTIKVTTYNGDSVVGTDSRTLKIIIDDSANPEITDFNLEPITKFNLSNVEKPFLVQAYGSVYFDITYNLSQGTTLKSCISTFCGLTEKTAQGSIPAIKSGKQRFETVVTDKRGWNTRWYKDFDVIPYVRPSVNVLYCGRPRSGSSSHYLEVEVETKVTSIKHEGVEQNKRKVIIDVMQKGTSQWETIHTDSSPGGIGTTRKIYKPSTVLADASSYDVRVVVQDEFAASGSVDSLGTANHLMVLGRSGVGFGKIPENDRQVDVQGDIWDRNGRNLSEFVTNIESNVTAVQDVSSSFGKASGVEEFYAKKIGKLIYIRFRYRPAKSGFNSEVVTAKKHLPSFTTALDVATTESTADSKLGVSAYISYNNGVYVVAPSIPSGKMVISGFYLEK